MNKQINNQDKNNTESSGQYDSDSIKNPRDDLQWGINNDYAPLTDVLLGVPEFFRWVDAGPLTARTLNNAEKRYLRTKQCQVSLPEVRPGITSQFFCP